MDCWIGVTTDGDHRVVHVAGRLRVAHVPELLTACAESSNLEIDLSLTATERFHMFWGPLDEANQGTGLIFDANRIDVDDRFK